MSTNEAAERLAILRAFLNGDVGARVAEDALIVAAEAFERSAGAAPLDDCICAKYDGHLAEVVGCPVHGGAAPPLDVERLAEALEFVENDREDDGLSDLFLGQNVVRYVPRTD